MGLPRVHARAERSTRAAAPSESVKFPMIRSAVSSKELSHAHAHSHGGGDAGSRRVSPIELDGPGKGPGKGRSRSTAVLHRHRVGGCVRAGVRACGERASSACACVFLCM